MGFLRLCLQEVRSMPRERREGELLDYKTDKGRTVESLASQSGERSAVVLETRSHGEGESCIHAQDKPHLKTVR
jgi:hypothetical protein